MPCEECEDGRWRWGATGDCTYASQEECESENGDLEAMSSRVLQAIAAQPWAITESGLQQIVEIAQRIHEKPEILTTRPRTAVDGTREASVRDGVGVLPVIGPVFRYANLFTEISGATSIQRLALDFQKLMDDSDVKSIVLEVDSPGGQVAGTSELAEKIRDARGVKSVTAYVSDVAASGAYWLASAAERIVIRDTGVVGSIGVVANVRVDKSENQVQIVSSQSPGKRPDVTTDKGKAEVQQLVDSIAQVFIETVASNRNVSVEDVLENFGKGGLVVGSEAVSRGMADGLGSLEKLITDLGGSDMSGDKSKMVALSALTLAMLAEERPDLVKEIQNDAKSGFGVELSEEQLAAARKEGADAERKRIMDVEAQGLKGHEELINKLKYDGSTTAAEAALQVLGAEREMRKGHLGRLETDSPDVLETAGVGAPLGTLEEAGKKKPKIDPDASVEERCQAQFDSDASIRTEFGNDLQAFIAYTEAEDAGLVKRLQRNSQG